MPTVETPNDSRSVGLDRLAYAFAAQVFEPRLSALTRADAADFAALANDLAAAETVEDRVAIVRAIIEILNGPRAGIAQLDLKNQADQPEGYKKWVKFVSKAVRDARQAAGMTQQQLHEKTGLPQSHISRIETGKHSPSHATLEKIAAALGKPVDHFSLIS